MPFVMGIMLEVVGQNASVLGIMPEVVWQNDLRWAYCPELGGRMHMVCITLLYLHNINSLLVVWVSLLEHRT